MIVFLNAALAGGLLAIAGPVIVHIAHRRKVKRLEWGAMRFLMAMLHKSRHRLFLEEWLLLLVRMAALLFLVLALMRPAVQPGALGLQQGVVQRTGRVAAILLFDDSVSSGAGRTRSSMEEMQDLACAYLDTLEDGDEISLLRLSELGEEMADPFFDRDRAKAMVRATHPSGVLSDIPALIEKGLLQLTRHLNPSAELVLVTDGQADGWKTDSRQRWVKLRRRLLSSENNDQDDGADPRLIVLSPAPRPGQVNTAIVGFEMDRVLLAAGESADVRVRLWRRGGQAATGLSLRLQVDGRTVRERLVDMPSAAEGGEREVSFDMRFEDPGSHVIEAVLVGARDALPVDDRRALAVEVFDSVSVLLVESTPREGLEGRLGFLRLALAPEHDNDNGEKGFFSVSQVAAADLGQTDLTEYRTIVLGDVLALDDAAVAALEQYIAAGGGVLVAVGPGTDMELVNRFWARRGDGFLPCPLLPPPDSAGELKPATVDLGHPALRAFAFGAGDVWAGCVIRNYYRLDTTQVAHGELDILIKLENGDPLVVERRRGLGRVALIVTGLDMRWNDLATQPAYVPLVRGLVGYLGSQVLPPRNLQAGQPITHLARIQADRVRLETPGGKVEDLERGLWEGRLAVVSSPLTAPGAYRLFTDGEEPDVYYAVQTAAQESYLTPLSEQGRDLALAGIEYAWLNDASAVTSSVDPARQKTEAWRWLLCMVLAALLVETLLTRLQQGESSSTSQTDAS